MTTMAWYVFPAAFVLDMILGDPRWLPHPIRQMGKAIEMTEPHFRKLPIPLSVSGALFAAYLILSAWGVAMIAISLAGLIHPILRGIVETLMIYYAISVRSLESSAMEVYAGLREGNPKLAKEKLALIVGRDVAPLDEAGIARAGVETVAENLTDGVISPLFFAAIGGAPLAMAYKMVNTLDSMVGYKNEKYAKFGKAAARIDDIADFVPARLSVFLIALAAEFLASAGVRAFKTGFAQGKHHSSPNSGFPEAAFAGVLKIRLGGPNLYGGQLVSKPYIGEEFGTVAIGDIPKACDLMVLASFSWLLIVWGL